MMVVESTMHCKEPVCIKVCIRIMLYQQILSRATPKCVEQLKCGEQKYIEDILNDRWQHHIQRQVLGTFAVYNF